MLRGMMMDRPLLVSSVIDFAAEIYPDVQVVSQTVEGGIHRYGYGAARERIGNALKTHEQKTTNQIVVLTVPTI